MKTNDTAGTVVALGSFDGLHLGHRAVLDAAKELARHLHAEPVLCTFQEHPLKVLTGQAPPSLFQGAVKDRLFQESGLDVYFLDFAEIKDQSPEVFFQTVLLEQLHAKGVCCGFNYSFGEGGKGTPELLERLCRENGIAFSEVPAKTLDGITVSSTVIRSAIEQGKISLATKMLGRDFSFESPVTHGDGRGRTWGIPTINQLYPEGLVVPKKGVYLSGVCLHGTHYKGVTNIGVRPTVREGEALSAETFVIGFSGDLYGTQPEVSLLQFLRPEQKFESFDALKAQIQKDIAIAKEAD